MSGFLGCCNSSHSASKSASTWDLIALNLSYVMSRGQSLSKSARTDKAGLQQQPACGELSGADIFFPQTWPKFGLDLGEKTDRLYPPLVRAWPSVQRHEATPPSSFSQARAHLCHPLVCSGRCPISAASSTAASPCCAALAVVLSRPPPPPPPSATTTTVGP